MKKKKTERNKKKCTRKKTRIRRHRHSANANIFERTLRDDRVFPTRNFPNLLNLMSLKWGTTTRSRSQCLRPSRATSVGGGKRSREEGRKSTKKNFSKRTKDDEDFRNIFRQTDTMPTTALWTFCTTTGKRKEGACNY